MAGAPDDGEPGLRVCRVEPSALVPILRPVTRRRRIILIILAVVIGVPILAAVGVGTYLRWGGLERDMSAQWTAAGLPGRLDIATVRFVGLHEAVVEGLSLGEPGRNPLATAAKAVVTFDLVDRRLLALRITGAHSRFDADGLRMLREIIRVEAGRVPTRAPNRVTVDVAGRLELPGGLTAEEVAVHVTALGAETRTEAGGMIAGRPARVVVSTARERADSPVITTVELSEAALDARQALAAVVGLELIRPLPVEASAFLPGITVLSGSRIVCDPVAETVRGAVVAQWEGGRLEAILDADSRRSVLDRLAVSDRRLGELAGRLQFANHGLGINLDATAWKAGPALPLPPRLSLAEVAALLPRLQVNWPLPGQRTGIILSGPGPARLEVQFGGGAPARIQAAELPLALLQPFLPQPLLIGGGHAMTATATISEGRPDIAVDVRQARFLAEGWSFGPLDGRIAAVGIPGAGVQVTAELATAELPIGRIAFSGSAGAGTLTVECRKVEALLARLRGPLQLPDLTGSLALEVGFQPVAEGTQVVVRRLDLGAAELRLKGRDLVRGLEARLRGAATFSPTYVNIDLGGQLRGGDLRLLGTWLPIAARLPIFAIDLVAALDQGALASLELRRAMVRVADATGEPVAGGWSAQLSGRLAGEHLAGAVEGVVDHADLSWLAGLIAPGEVKVTGEGAVTFRAQVDAGEVTRIDGTFLPLGTDIDVGHGKIRVGGITGGIDFTLGGR